MRSRASGRRSDAALPAGEGAPRRLALVILGLVALPLVGGCEYLFGPTWTGDGATPVPLLPGETPGPLPAAHAYRTGTAAITFEGMAPIELDFASASVSPFDEGMASWTDGNGWYLQVESQGGSGGAAWISIDRVAAGHVYEAGDDACSAMVTVTAAGMDGTATCKTLAWRDMLALDAGAASPVPGISPARASITFSARP